VSIIGLLGLLWFADKLSPQVLYTTEFMLLVLPVAALAKTVAHAMCGLQRVVIGQAVDMLLRPLLVLLMVAVIFFVWPGLREPQIAMAAQLVATLIVLLAGVWALRQFLPDDVHGVPAQYRSRQWLKSALPFTLIGGAGIINNQADIIMLGWFRTSEEVGVYRVAVQGAALVILGLQAANAVVAPHFAQLYAKGDMAQLQRLVTLSARVILLAALPIALAFIIAGGPIVGRIFGAEFTASYLPLAILTAGQLVNASMGSVGFLLNMTGHERDTARTLWQAAVLNVVLNVILIPFYGMAGAAVASTTSLVVWNLVLRSLVWRRLGLNSTAFAIRCFR
jgi:O-antigen/teichoic acid export membrane protein